MQCFYHTDGVYFIRKDDDTVIVVKLTETGTTNAFKSDKPMGEVVLNLISTGDFVWKHEMSGSSWVSIIACMGNGNYDDANKLFKKDAKG